MVFTPLYNVGTATWEGRPQPLYRSLEVVIQSFTTTGYGDSGRAAAAALDDSGAELTVLDVATAPDVDVMGDTRDPETLDAAGIESASALIVAVGDDTTAIFVTLIARELNPDLHVVVRANEGDDVQKLYRAGGDYVQSLATISGRMLASTVFEDEEVPGTTRESTSFASRWETPSPASGCGPKLAVPSSPSSGTAGRSPRSTPRRSRWRRATRWSSPAPTGRPRDSSDGSASRSTGCAARAMT